MQIVPYVAKLDYNPPQTRMLLRPKLRMTGFVTFRAENIPWGTEEDVPSLTSRMRRKPYKPPPSRIQVPTYPIPPKLKPPVSVVRNDFGDPKSKLTEKDGPLYMKARSPEAIDSRRVIVSRFPVTTGVSMLSEVQDNFKLSCSVLGAKEEKQQSEQSQKASSQALTYPAKRTRSISKESRSDQRNVNFTPSTTSVTMTAIEKPPTKPGIKTGYSGKIHPQSAKTKRRLAIALEKARVKRERELSQRQRNAEKARLYSESIRQANQSRQQQDREAVNRGRCRRGETDDSRPLSSSIKTSAIAEERSQSRPSSSSRLSSAKVMSLGQQLHIVSVFLFSMQRYIILV